MTVVELFVVVSSRQDVTFSPLPFVCWLVCWQDYRKTTGQIFTKHGWRMGFGPEETPLTFYADSDKRTDPGIFFSDFFLTWHDKREM